MEPLTIHDLEFYSIESSRPRSLINPTNLLTPQEHFFFGGISFEYSGGIYTPILVQEGWAIDLVNNTRQVAHYFWSDSKYWVNYKGLQAQGHSKDKPAILVKLAPLDLDGKTIEDPKAIYDSLSINPEFASSLILRV